MVRTETRTFVLIPQVHLPHFMSHLLFDFLYCSKVISKVHISGKKGTAFIPFNIIKIIVTLIGN